MGAKTFIDVGTLLLGRVSSCREKEVKTVIQRCKRSNQIDSEPTVMLEASLAHAMVTTIRVDANGVNASVEVFGAALVDVVASDTVALIAGFTLASVATGSVDTHSVLIALMLSSCAFVEILWKLNISII